ncbi:7655_t:CDS:2 [Ambispora gerdemannii]|uniref:7655_t:CDS:1 n=1 Tax=Ambispora gerdemannii TaxID=144530 RepID=A0A9N9B969_9GLOM|nr:7655_t:CDS:2 [Ambispora gerdemannii]
MSQHKKSITRENLPPPLSTLNLNRAKDVSSDNKSNNNSNNIKETDNYSQVSIPSDSAIPTSGFFNDLLYIPPSEPPSPSINNSFRNYTYTGAPHSQNSIKRSQKGKVTNGSSQSESANTRSNLRDDSNTSTQIAEKLEPIGQQQTQNDEVSDDIYDIYDRIRIKEDRVRSPNQRKFYYFFEHPSSIYARIFAVFSALCVFVMMIIICVESLPAIYKNEWRYYREIWLPVDIVVVIVFTTEFAGRLYASVDRIAFMKQLWNIIDVATIVPFYTELFLPLTSEITMRVFKRSASQIALVSTWVFVIILTSSALLYYLERGDFNDDDNTWYRIGLSGQLEVSPYQSIIHSFWWSIVTITTTGYGDAVPLTGWGKVVSGMTMLCGILVIAVPTSIIGSNFVTEWALHRRVQFQMRLRRTRENAFAAKKFHENKNERMETLQNQNQTMLEALAEIQERLADINPPQYWQKYKKLQIEHEKAKLRIAELEEKVVMLKRTAKNLENFNNFGRTPKAKKGNFETIHKDSYFRGTEETNEEYNNSTQNSYKKWTNFKLLKFKKYPTTSEIASTKSVSDSEIDIDKNTGISLTKTPLKVVKKLRQTFLQERKVGNSLQQTPHISDKEWIVSSPIEAFQNTNPLAQDDNVSDLVQNDSESTNIQTQSEPPSDNEDNQQSVMTFPGTAKELKLATLAAGKVPVRRRKSVRRQLHNLTGMFEKESKNKNDLDPGDQDLEKGLGGIRAPIASWSLPISITPTRLSPSRLTPKAQVNDDNNKFFNENNIEIFVERTSPGEKTEKIQNDSEFVVDLADSKLPLYLEPELPYYTQNVQQISFTAPIPTPTDSSLPNSAIHETPNDLTLDDLENTQILSEENSQKESESSNRNSKNLTFAEPIIRNESPMRKE